MGDLYNAIKNFKNGETDEIVYILNLFEPLLNKLQRNSNCEDMKNELSLFMFTVLNKIPLETQCFKEDKYIVSYIHKSLKYKYMSLNKLNQKIRSTEIESDFTLLNSFNDVNPTSYIFFNDIIKNLTKNEQNILQKIYIDGLNESEISRCLNISRQAVNKTHSRALKKLKKIKDLRN